MSRNIDQRDQYKLHILKRFSPCEIDQRFLHMAGLF